MRYCVDGSTFCGHRLQDHVSNHMHCGHSCRAIDAEQMHFYAGLFKQPQTTMLKHCKSWVLLELMSTAPTTTTVLHSTCQCPTAAWTPRNFCWTCQTSTCAYCSTWSVCGIVKSDLFDSFLHHTISKTHATRSWLDVCVNQDGCSQCLKVMSFKLS